MAQQTTIHLFRCVLDGTYFGTKEAALLHMRVYHDFKQVDEAMLKEVEFPVGS